MLFSGHLLRYPGHVMQHRRKPLPPPPAPAGTWIQTERALHERWAQFLGLRGATAASRVMHLLLARLRDVDGTHNAVVISNRTLAQLLGCDERTVRRGIAMLQQHRWIEVRQIGERGTVNAFIINDRVAWFGERDDLKYSIFSAAIVLSADEQPDKDELGQQAPLHHLPTMLPGERQLPSGEGLPPPSQPSLPSLEPDLPARIIVDPAALAAWSGRPRNDRLRLARRVVALQHDAGEIALEASQLADKPAQLLAEATRLGLRF